MPSLVERQGEPVTDQSKESKGAKAVEGDFVWDSKEAKVEGSFELRNFDVEVPKLLRNVFGPFDSFD